MRPPRSIQIHPTILYTIIHIHKNNFRERMKTRRNRHCCFVTGACEALPAGSFDGETLEPPCMAPPASPGPGAGDGEYDPWLATVGTAVSGGN